MTIPITPTNQGGAVDADYDRALQRHLRRRRDLKDRSASARRQDSDNDDGESVLLSFGTLPAGVSEGAYRGPQGRRW